MTVIRVISIVQKAAGQMSSVCGRRMVTVARPAVNAGLHVDARRDWTGSVKERRNARLRSLSRTR